MPDLTAEQSVQEGRYDYPYHYIPFWDGQTFSQTQTWDWGYEYLSYLSVILDKAVATSFDSLLDVGCGDGRLLSELSKRAPGKRLAGIDFSERAIEYAKIMAPGIEWVHGDITNDGLFEPRFGTVTLIETLEHIEPGKIDTFVSAIHGYTTDSGTLIVSVPSTNVAVLDKHYQHFDKDSLASTLAPSFEVTEVAYLNRLVSIGLRIMRLLLSNRLFLLNSKLLLRWIYQYYTAKHLFAREGDCIRLVAVCRRIP